MSIFEPNPVDRVPEQSSTIQNPKSKIQNPKSKIQNQSLLRPTHAIIDLDVIERNLRTIRTTVGSRTGVLAVVKADAYGHGMVRVARVVTAAGADMLGVANVEEGRVLRRAGVETPVLILGASLPEEASEIVAYRLIPMVCSSELAEALAAQGRALDQPVSAHVKVDTGMGRLGVSTEDAFAFIERLSRMKGLSVDGIFTHFACADEPDLGLTRVQIDRFQTLLTDLGQAGRRPAVAHAANSGALLDWPSSYFDMVRPGLLLYGYYPSASASRRVAVQPSLVWKTRIVHLKRVAAGTGLSYGHTYVTPRETVIATLPVGYEDGYVRTLSNRGFALVGGQRVPVVGRVCMDQILVDLGNETATAVGDEVVLIGRQGNAEITVEGFAAQAGTVPNEIVCMIDKRVSRVFVRSGVLQD